MYLVRIFPAARSAGFQARKITWESRKQNAKETFFIPSVTFFYSLVDFNEVRERTWLGSSPCAACGGNSTGLNAWESRRRSAGFPAARSAGCRLEKSHGRAGERKRKKRFSFHLQRLYALIEFDEVRERTWLGFFLPPAVRDFRQEKSPGRVGGRTRKKHFSFRLQCPNALVVFNEVRERTWLGSFVRQKAILPPSGDNSPSYK